MNIEISNDQKSYAMEKLLKSNDNLISYNNFYDWYTSDNVYYKIKVIDCSTNEEILNASTLNNCYTIKNLTSGSKYA